MASSRAPYVLRSFVSMSIVMLALAGSGLAASMDEEWKNYWSKWDNVQVSGKSLGDVLKPMIDYNFTLPPYALKRGYVYRGHAARLRRMARDLLEGEKTVKVGIIGGSISHGHGVAQGMDWGSILSRWLTKSFRNAPSLRNGCIPGTPSAYMVVCLDMSVDQDVDLVFSEYVLNDGRVLTINTTKTKDVERLTRRVYALPNKPAMANMQVMSYGQAFPYMGRLKSDVWKDTDVWTPFHFTPEDIYGAVVQYYGTQWLSFRTATYRMVHAEHRLDYKDIFQDDGMHPNDKGHKVMADLAVWMIIQSVIDVFLHPFDADDARHITEDLPPPMVPGNDVPSSPMCVHNEAVKRLVLNSSGFEFVAEGSRMDKKGFVATSVGSTLFLKVNTQRTEPGQVYVELAYLKSYEHMGMAVAECVSGCTCYPKEICAHEFESKESQTYLAILRASQHPECVVRLQVVEESYSPGKEHKFKLSGIIISDQANPAAGEKYLTQFLNENAFSGGHWVP